LQKIKPHYAVIVPSILFAIHSFLFRGWIVDDAGISYAYARNLAEGYGLTSYRGFPPVEGISNFLWTILLTPFFLLKLFNPVLTPKIIALVFLCGVFLFNRKIIVKMGLGELAAVAVNVLLAINTPLVAWSQSGMENSLFAFLLSAYCYYVMKFSGEQKKSFLNTCAVIAFLISITRPEGIYFAAALPLSLLAIEANLKAKINYLLNFSLVLLIPIIAFLLFRYLYFHDWLPNTYYAKGRHHAFAVFDLAHAIKKFRYLSFSIGGRGAVFLLLFSGFMIPFLGLYYWKKNKTAVVLVIFYILSFFHFMLLPDDWMRELRFATPFIIFVFPYLSVLLFFISERFKWMNYKLVVGFCTVYILYSAYHFYNRSQQFAQKPTVPFGYVKRTFADVFNSYSVRLNLHDASVLLPDVGATLFYSKIKVYDAAGLCDRTIGRTIYADANFLHDYIFETIKPTFIHLHSTWSARINADDDERFRRDYLPIHEYREDSLSAALNKNIMSGNYIRKDAVNNSNASALDSIISEEKIKAVHW
jgi:hypothetical protein